MSKQQNCSSKQFPPPVTGAAALEPIIMNHCIKLHESIYCVELEHYLKHDYKNKTIIFLLLHGTAQKSASHHTCPPLHSHRCHLLKTWYC